MRGDAEAAGLHLYAVQLAEKLSGFGFKLLFFLRDVRNHIAENIERGHARVPRATDRLHRADEDVVETEAECQRRQCQNETDCRAVGISDDESAVRLEPPLRLQQFQMVRIYFGDDEWNILMHAEALELVTTAQPASANFGSISAAAEASRAAKMTRGAPLGA